jgi:hypothetical protein
MPRNADQLASSTDLAIRVRAKPLLCRINSFARTISVETSCKWWRRALAISQDHVRHIIGLLLRCIGSRSISLKCATRWIASCSPVMANLITLVEYPRKVSVSALVNALKGTSSRLLRKARPDIANRYRDLVAVLFRRFDGRSIHWKWSSGMLKHNAPPPRPEVPSTMSTC